ncbi:ABC transporter substrate-binding protein [Paraburkholderia sp. MM5477-R1]|uniref:ABC transporter substrate-binding protein n=1 Tax=Paraburkholderia sp. MM5477-R1 TaxID=2991062 RepID=UPI003D2324DD
MKIVRRDTAAIILSASILSPLSYQASAQEKSWTDVVTAAKNEKTVVFYTGAVANKCVDAIINDFRNKYGIDVQSLKARGGELLERIRVEQSTSRFVADVEWNGPPPIFIQSKAGALEPLGKLPNLANLRQGVSAEQYAVPVFANYVGVLVNGRLVKDEDVKSWKNLTDPKWKGKLVSDQLDVMSNGNIWFDVTRKAFGDTFHQGIANNNPLMARDLGVVQRSVATGERLIYINQDAADAFAAKGLPVRWVVPQEGAPFYYAKAAVLKNAPHPNAARLFINHLLDTKSQLACAAEGMSPVVNGVVEKVDPSVRHFIEVKNLGEQSPDPAVIGSAIEAAKTIYKK